MHACSNLQPFAHQPLHHRRGDSGATKKIRTAHQKERGETYSLLRRRAYWSFSLPQLIKALSKDSVFFGDFADRLRWLKKNTRKAGENCYFVFSFELPVFFFSFSRRKSESETNQNDRSSTPPVHILPILHHLSIIFEKEMVGGWWVGGKETHVQRGLLAYPVDRPTLDSSLNIRSTFGVSNTRYRRVFAILVRGPRKQSWWPSYPICSGPTPSHRQ